MVACAPSGGWQAYGVMITAICVPVGGALPEPLKPSTLSHEPGTMAVGDRDPEPLWLPADMGQLPMECVPLASGATIKMLMAP